MTLSISVSEEFLQLVSPIRAMSMAFLCMWLVTAFLGLIISFFNVVVTKMSGVVAAGGAGESLVFAVYWGANSIGRWLHVYIPGVLEPDGRLGLDLQWNVAVADIRSGGADSGDCPVGDRQRDQILPAGSELREGREENGNIRGGGQKGSEGV
ncbi:MAG: hypothetical protein ACLR23_16690 [Clostridia bacterium]